MTSHLISPFYFVIERLDLPCRQSLFFKLYISRMVIFNHNDTINEFNNTREKPAIKWAVVTKASSLKEYVVNF